MKRFLKNKVIRIAFVVLIVSALPLSIWELAKTQSIKTKADTFSLVPYPQLSWSTPKEYTVSLLTNPQTPDEELILSKGMVVTAESTENKSSAISFFYKNLLESKEYELIKQTGDPQTDTHWVMNYKSLGNLVQIQYYPTPYKDNSYTILLFFGNL